MRPRPFCCPLYLLCLLALAPLTGVAHAGPRIQAITYPSGTDKVPGHLAVPGVAGKHPAVVVIHEWWGVNDWVKARTEGFARKGYVALAVDLYRGQVATDPDTAHQLMRGLPEDRALRDLGAALTYLAGRADVDVGRIGVVGWCMGGGQALALAATADPRVAAAVIYYGRLMTDPAGIARIKAPLLGNFGQADRGIPAESVNAFAEAVRKAGGTADFKVYPGVGHAFASSRDPKAFNAEAAKDADARTEAFFEKYLKRKRPR